MMELKPCPFCGGEAILRNFDGADYKCECTNNFCQASYMIGMNYDTEEDAIEAWNRRITDGTERKAD